MLSLYHSVYGSSNYVIVLYQKCCFRYKLKATILVSITICCHRLGSLIDRCKMSLFFVGEHP